jgi:hypothetical protein
MYRGKTHFRCLSGGGATLETFLTLLLCCERCSQTPPTLALRNVSSACSMPLLEKISNVPSGTTLSWQCSRSTTNAISEVLLLCVCVCVCGAIYIYMYPLLRRRALCVCVCVCVCVVQSIFESILEYLSIYLSIYLRMYLSICSWSLPCQRCLCWSLPFVCVCVYYCSTYEKAVRVGGLVCVCVF